MSSNDVLMQLEDLDRSHQVDPNLNRFCLAWVLLEGMNAIQSKIMINTLTLTPKEPKETKGQKDLAVQRSRSSRAGPSSSRPTEGVPGQQCTKTQDKLNKQNFWTQIVKASTKANKGPVFSPAGLSRFQLFMAKLLLALIDPSKHGDQTSVDQIVILYEHLTQSEQASIKLRLPKTFQFDKNGHVINMPKLTMEDQKKAELILQYLPSRKTMLEYLAANKWQKGIEGAASIPAALPHENNILTREKPLTTQSMRLFWNLADRSDTPKYMITPGFQVVPKTGAELALGGLEAGAGRQSRGGETKQRKGRLRRKMMNRCSCRPCRILRAQEEEVVVLNLGIQTGRILRYMWPIMGSYLDHRNPLTFLLPKCPLMTPHTSSELPFTFNLNLENLHKLHNL